jgi:hypothetical protein
MAKQDQNLFTLTRENSGASRRRAAGVKGMPQYVRTDVRNQSFTVRTVQKVEQPQSRDTARDLNQKEVQGRKS